MNDEVYFSVEWRGTSRHQVMIKVKRKLRDRISRKTVWMVEKHQSGEKEW